MGKELVNKTMEMFDSIEKWNSYLELVKLKEEMRNQWFFKSKTVINKYFLEKDVVDGWSFYAWNAWDFRWYLTDFGKESFCIWMFSNRLCFWANPQLFDVAELTRLLNTENYAIIMSLLRPDEIFNQTGFQISEFGNFSFDSVFDYQIEPDQLGWLSANYSENYVSQIAEKINQVRKDENITNLFRELNIQAKK